jgi:ribosomal protein S18 acetylase RimI-like enzyme
MESFRIDGNSLRKYAITVEEVGGPTADLIRTLVEIDLQTFAESTFSPYTAIAFLHSGRAFLLRADDVIIGTCVCYRAWERPNEVTLLAMGIRPGWRGRGLGQRFIAGVLDRLRARGIRAVNLLVGADNRRAIRVYTDVGFRPAEASIVDPQSGDVLLQMRAVLQDEQSALIELRNGADGEDPSG